MLDGVSLISAERERQKSKWSAEHDANNTDGSLAVNAAALAVEGTDASISDPFGRHRDGDRWALLEKHTGDRVRQLVIAGALIAAEIDRLCALSATDEPTIDMPIGYLLDHADDWDAFCKDVGLNPWLLNEGLATRDDKHPIPMSVLRKHGILG